MTPIYDQLCTAYGFRPLAHEYLIAIRDWEGRVVRAGWKSEDD